MSLAMYIETRDLESRPFRRFIGVPSGCTSSSICIYWYTCLFSDLCSLCKIMLAEAQQSIEKRNPETYTAKMCRTEQPGLALFPFLPYLQPLSVGTRVWVYPLHCEAHSCSQSENVLCGSSINVLSLLTLTSKTSRIFQTAPRWDLPWSLQFHLHTRRLSLPSWLPSSSASSGWPEMHLGCIGQHNFNLSLHVKH